MARNVCLTILLSLGITSAIAGSLGMAESVDNFDGFYIGLGAGFTTIYTNDTLNSSISGVTNPILSGSIPSTETGVLFTGNVGYGKMFNQKTYLGAKGTIYYKPGENGRNNVFFGQVPGLYYFTDNTNVKRSIQPFYNIDAVLGYEVIPRVLPFVEGGVTVSNINNRFASAATAYTPTTSVNYNEVINLEGYRTGYNLGLGVNFLAAKNWFLYSELLYNDLGSQAATLINKLPAAGITKTTTLTEKNQAVFFVVGASWLFSA